MASIITSISLDPETADIRDRLIAQYGFSKWIRECLYRYAAVQGETTHSQDEDARIRGLCNGLLVPPCRLCWPEGPPSREGWIEWRMGSETKPKPKHAYFALPDAEPENKRQKGWGDGMPRYGTAIPDDPVPAKVKPGLLPRFILWLI